jgi:hypothetical protein
MRNLVAPIPRSAREPVAAIVRRIFAKPGRATAMAQLHRLQLHGTNRLERLNKESSAARPSRDLLNRSMLLPIVGTVLAEQDAEWIVAAAGHDPRARALVTPFLHDGGTATL